MNRDIKSRMRSKSEGSMAVSQGESNFLRALREEHRDIMAQVEAFKEFKTYIDRKNCIKDIKNLIHMHTEIEEELLYPALREYGFDDKYQECLSEHEKLSQILNKIEDQDYSETSLDSLFEKFESKLADHLQDEEETVFKVLRENLNNEKFRELESGYRYFRPDKKFVA